MKINVGDFGMATPGEVAGPNVPAQAFVTQGVPELGSAGLKIGHEMAQAAEQDAQLAYSEQHQKRLQAEHEMKVVAAEAKRSEMMKIEGQAHVALAAAHTDIVNGIQTGAISTDAAPKLWQEQSQKIVADHVKTADKVNAELLRNSLIGPAGRFGEQVRQAVFKQNLHAIGANLNDYLEEMDQLSLTDLATAKKQGVMAIRSQGPLAGYNPEAVSKMEHATIERFTFNAMQNTLIGIENNRDALDRYVKALPTVPDLDSAKRNNLYSLATHSITRLENKAISAENRRLAKLQTLGGKLETQIASGAAIAATDLDTYQRAAKGTVFEEFANGLADEQQQVAEILKKPLIEQADFVGKMEQNYLASGEGNRKVIDRLKQTVEKGFKLYKNNSMQYASQRAGAQVEPLDITQPASWASNLGNRADVWAGLQRQTGIAPGGPLFPQEAQALAKLLRESNLSTKTSILEQFRNGLGDKPYRAAMQQIAPDDPVTAAAGIAAGQGDRIRAANILRGQELLRPNRKEDGQPAGGKVLQMPKDDDLVKDFALKSKNAFAGNAEAGSLYFQTARAIYARMSDDEGDGTGVLNSGRWTKAIDEATGGFANHNSRNLLLPHGMPYGDFKDSLQRRVDQIVVSKQLDESWTRSRLMALPLENTADAAYAFRSGDGKVVDKQGREVVIDFTQSAPFIPSGTEPYKKPVTRRTRSTPNG